MSTWQKALFIGILLLGIVVRFYQLGDIPSGFHGDEACFGYNAYSIMKTGKDEWGKPFPLILKSWGDYKGGVYSYLMIPFIRFFGLNEWSVRAPSAFAGVGLVLLTYAIAYALTKRKDIAFLSMALEAVSPMPVVLSRVQSDPLLSVFFVFLGLYFFLLWTNTSRSFYIGLACISWLISMFTNTLPRLYFLLLIPLLVVEFFPSIGKLQKKLFIFSGILIMLFVVALWVFASSRFNQVGVFSKQDVTLLLEENIREDGIGKSPLILTRMFHNKITEYGRYMLSKYFQYMDYDFLVHQSGQPLREQIPHTGIIYLLELPFLLLGIFFALERRLRWGIFLTMLFLCTPIILSFAQDETPNIHRFAVNTVPLCILTGFGLADFVHWLQRKRYLIIIPVICVLFICSIWYFLHNLFIHQPIHFPYNREYSYKPLVETVKKYYPEYDKIIITKESGSPFYQILFYWPYDPETYIQMGSPHDADDSGFDKFLFAAHACPSLSKKYVQMAGNAKTLYINRSSCPIESKDIKEKVRWKNGTDSFYLTNQTYTPEEIALMH